MVGNTVQERDRDTLVQCMVPDSSPHLMHPIQILIEIVVTQLDLEDD